MLYIYLLSPRIFDLNTANMLVTDCPLTNLFYQHLPEDLRERLSLTHCSKADKVPILSAGALAVLCVVLLGIFLTGEDTFPVSLNIFPALDSISGSAFSNATQFIEPEVQYYTPPSISHI